MLFSSFIVSSDSGILYYDHRVGVYRYGGIPYQDAMIFYSCLLYTSPSPRDGLLSRMPSSA